MDSGFAGAALLAAPLRAKWGKSEAPRSGKNESWMNGCQAAGGWVGEKSAEGWAGECCVQWKIIQPPSLKR